MTLMIQRTIALLFLVFFLSSPCDAGMLRVVSIDDGRTVTVESGGVRERVKLAGVAITDELAARELLRWTLLERWILLERDAGGGVRLWRSPDALFVNRELVARGYAKATAPGIAAENTPVVTYLGTLNPPATPQKVTPEAKSGSGTRPRSTAPPKRRARPPK